MQKRKTSIVLWIVVVAIGSVTLSGCLKTTTPQPTPARTYVSIMHLAATAPSIDVFFNDEKVSTNAFTPGSVSAAYNAIEKGNFSVKLKKASSDSIVAGLPVALYDSLRFYTILLYNPQVNGPAEIVRIHDDFTQVSPGKPFYRFFHTSPSVNAVDLYMDNIRIQSGRMLADNATYESLNGFLETSTGAHAFAVKLAGTDSTIASRDNVELLSGNAYTLFLRSLNGGSNPSELFLGILRAAN